MARWIRTHRASRCVGRLDWRRHGAAGTAVTVWRVSRESRQPYVAPDPFPCRVQDNKAAMDALTTELRERIKVIRAGMWFTVWAGSVGTPQWCVAEPVYQRMPDSTPRLGRRPCGASQWHPAGGGAKAIQKHISRNKMFVRDRIDALLDVGCVPNPCDGRRRVRCLFL